MKLWLLERFKDDRPFYDSMYGFVIRAKSPHAARHIAAERCGDEGEHTWLSPKCSSCSELKPEGKHGVILSDFNAG